MYGPVQYSTVQYSTVQYITTVIIDNSGHGHGHGNNWPDWLHTVLI